MYCSNCGEEIASRARFCGSCGTSVSDDRESSGSFEEARASSEPTARPFRVDQQDSIDGLRIAPRSAGELVSDTFNLFMKNPMPFIGIAAIPYLFNVLINFVDNWVLVAVIGIINGLMFVAALGALWYAAGLTYARREVDVVNCYSRSISMFLNLLVAFIVVGLIIVLTVLLSFIIVGIPLFFYVAVIWAFAGPIIVFERAGPIYALKRSGSLVQGLWWRTFGVGALFVLIAILLSIPVGIVSAVVGSIVNDTAGGVVGSILGMFVAPFAQIGLALVYFDLRTRKETFTVEMITRPRPATIDPMAQW